MILATVTAMALAADPPILVDAPDPVLEWAERDLRALRGSRVAMAMSVTGPPLMTVGVMTAIQIQALKAREVVRPRDYFGAGVGFAGLGATLIGPPLLASKAMRSTRALRNQFLDVSTGPAWLSWSIMGTTATYMAIVVPAAGLGSRATYVWVPLIVAYVGSVSASAVQLRMNHKVRQNAGWLGDLSVAPIPIRGGASLALTWTL